VIGLYCDNLRFSMNIPSTECEDMQLIKLYCDNLWSILGKTKESECQT